MKICHIRGKENYWEQVFDHIKYPDFTYRDCIYLLYRKLNIDYFDYRKKIRDIIINDIHENSTFDVICYNDTELYELCQQINDNTNITYYAQDDDDIFLGPIERNQENGLHISKNTFLYPKNILRKNNKFSFLKNNNIQVQHLAINSPIGSCNVIIQEKFKHLKQELVTICKKSEHACTTTPRRVIDSKLYNVFYNDEILSIHILHSLSLTFLRKMANYLGDVNSSAVVIKALMLNHNNTVLKINIPDVPVWGHIKKTITQLNEELH